MSCFNESSCGQGDPWQRASVQPLRQGLDAAWRRGGEAARPREPAALRVAARVEPGRAEPRVPLRHLGAKINQKVLLITNYFFNFFLSGKFIMLNNFKYILH